MTTEFNVGINSKDAESGSRRVQTALGKMSSAASRVSSTMSRMFNPLTATIGGIATAASAIKLAKVGDEYTNMASQLEFLTGSVVGAEEAQKDLLRMSQRTGTSMTANAKSITRFQLASELTGLTMRENIKVLGGINTLMLKTGTSSQEASVAMIQLGQALASGRLAGDEFRAMSEAAPGVMLALSKSLGISRGELKEWSSQGKLTSEVLGQAFLDIADSGAASAENLPLTIGRMWTKIVNSFENAWDKINDQTGILSFIATGFDNLSQWIEAKTPQIVLFFEKMKVKIVEIWPDIKQFFTGFMEGAKAAFEQLVAAWPSIQTFFGNLMSVIKALVPWINRAIEGWKLLASWAGAAGAANDLAKQTAFSRRQMNESGYTQEQVDSVDREFDQSQNAAGGGVVNINLNGQYSKSDVANIALDTQRLETRT